MGSDDVSVLLKDPNSVVEWAAENSMVLHEEEFLTYRTPRSIIMEELPFTTQWIQYSTSSDCQLCKSSFLQLNLFETTAITKQIL